MASGGKGEVSFADGDFVGFVGGGLEVALLDCGKGPADVTGVDGDVDLVEGWE